MTEERKPEHENGEELLVFITTVTVPECIKRLEKAAARAADQRLTVQVDGQNFVVEMPWPRFKSIYRQLPSVARLQATISETANGTQVQGQITDTIIRVFGMELGAFLCTAGSLLLIILGVLFASQIGGGIAALCLFGIAAAALLLVAALRQGKIQAENENVRHTVWGYAYQWLYQSPNLRN